jgi:hypothetical protein
MSPLISRRCNRTLASRASSSISPPSAWLVTDQVVATNPAHAVRGPSHVVKSGKTTVLDADQARHLLDSIDTSTVVGLRDRALIALMTYSFARVSAAADRTPPGDCRPFWRDRTPATPAARSLAGAAILSRAAFETRESRSAEKPRPPQGSARDSEAVGRSQSARCQQAQVDSAD